MKLSLTFAALMAGLFCTATALGQQTLTPLDDSSCTCNSELAALDAKIAACCEQKATPPPPAPKPKPYPNICGYGTKEFVDDGKLHKLPQGQHCTCLKPKDGEPRRILVSGPPTAEGRPELCPPGDAVTKVYVDRIADGKVDKPEYDAFKKEMHAAIDDLKKGQVGVVHVDDGVFVTLVNTVQAQGEQIAAVQKDVADLKERVDNLPRYWVSLMLGVGGTLIYRDATFAGDGHVVGILTANLTDVVGLIAEGQLGILGGETINGADTRAGGGVGVVFNPDGAPAQHRLALEVAFLQDNRLENDTSGSTGNGAGYQFGPKLRYIWSPLDWLSVSPFAGIGWGVVGHEISGNRSLVRPGFQANGGLEILFGGGVGRKDDSDSADK